MLHCGSLLVSSREGYRTVVLADAEDRGVGACRMHRPDRFGVSWDSCLMEGPTGSR